MCYNYKKNKKTPQKGREKIVKLHELRKITEKMQPISGPGDQQKIHELLRTIGLDPGNFYQELEMSSRFVDTHQDMSFSNANVSLHSHTFYEILYCRGGTAVEYLVGPDRYRLQKGDIILIPPGVSHRPILPEEMKEPYVRDVLWVSSEFVDMLANTFPDNTAAERDHSTPIRTAGTRWESVGELFRSGVREAEQQAPGWEAAVVGNTLLIFSQLKRAYIERSAGELKAEKRELLDEITAYIEAHYPEHLTLSDVARRFYVSESTVSHLFKQKMGVSLYRYITQRRLIAAKNRILEGLPLEDVAEQVGFADYSSFYRAFKGEFGISPRQFRNQSTKET